METINKKEISKKTKSKILAFILSLTMSLTSCASTTEDKKENVDTKYQYTIISFNEKEYMLEIKSYTRWGEDWIEFVLADDSSIFTSIKNMMICFNDSKAMEIFYNDHDIYDIETVLSDNSGYGRDAVLLSVNGKIYSMGLEDHIRKYENWIELKLSDGSSLNTDAENIIIYDSNSKMMDQVEEKGQVKILEP